jgi:hypothetical protein
MMMTGDEFSKLIHEHENAQAQADARLEAAIDLALHGAAMQRKQLRADLWRAIAASAKPSPSPAAAEKPAGST